MAAILQSCSADQNSDGKGGWSSIKYQQRTHSWSTIMVYVDFPVWSPHCMWRQHRVNCTCCFMLHLLQCSPSHRTGEKKYQLYIEGTDQKACFQLSHETFNSVWELYTGAAVFPSPLASATAYCQCPSVLHILKSSPGINQGALPELKGTASKQGPPSHRDQALQGS